MREMKGVIFDLDGTILDSAWVWQKIDIDFLGRRGIDVPEDYVEHIIPLSFEQAAVYTIDRFHLAASKEEVMAEWNQMALEAYSERVCIKTGTREVLDWFRAQNIPMGVATSNIENLFLPCLKRNGIYEYFHSFTESREVSRGKEYPDIYIKEAEKLGCKPQECIVFEDILPALRSAGAGGFYTIAVEEKAWGYDRKEVEADCDYYVTKIQDVLALLNEKK